MELTEMVHLKAVNAMRHFEAPEFPNSAKTFKARSHTQPPIDFSSTISKTQ
jgi:hypothetical protein